MRYSQYYGVGSSPTSNNKIIGILIEGVQDLIAPDTSSGTSDTLLSLHISLLSHACLTGLQGLGRFQILKTFLRLPASSTRVPWISLQINFCDSHSPSNSAGIYYEEAVQIWGPSRLGAPTEWCRCLLLLCWPWFTQDSVKELRLREN